MISFLPDTVASIKILVLLFFLMYMNGLSSREHYNWRRFTDVTADVLQMFVFNSKSYSCFLARNLITMVFYSNLHWNACWAVSVLKVFRYDTWYKFVMWSRCKINEIERSTNLPLDIVTRMRSRWFHRWRFHLLDLF